MHAARAIHKQREKREEKAKLDVRRPSSISQSSRAIPRSPAVSVDTSARKSQAHSDESDSLNFSYIGFIIAVFGAVPLIVGTFVEVPALWEIGLGVTLVGLFIGIVFWCTELCAEAKKFSQKKNQLSSRGKIEDSNLLQVPERKFGNGMDSRRGSFQSDSVSLISPAVQQHYTPKHHTNLPQVHRNSISQYSSDHSTSSSTRTNGHLVPPALILRGNGRRDDGRVVSLVQPEPGLDDDSDSDAETVIEAPTSHNTRVIQVQTCQEKQLQKPLLNTSFNIENEKISPLVSQHRTIRMPVLPQELDKLQKCECGRYLLTDRDKMFGIKLPGIAGSGSASTTTSNSPTPPPSSLLPVPGTGNASAVPPNSNMIVRRDLDLNLEDAYYDNDTSVSLDPDVTTPLADQLPPPPPNKIISVNPSVKIAPPVPPTSQNVATSTAAIVAANVMESLVQVDPSLNSSTAADFLSVTSARKKTEDVDDDFDDDDEDEVVTPGNESSKTFQEAVVVVEEEKDRILTELLELTDVNDVEETSVIEKMEASGIVEPEARLSASNDENHNTEIEERCDNEPPNISREGSRRKLQYQSKVTSITRPTSLPLPASLTDTDAGESTAAVIDHVKEIKDEEAVEQQHNAADLTVDQGQQSRTESGKSREKNSDLAQDMSLDELLDSIEKNQEGEILAVVVQ